MDLLCYLHGNTLHFYKINGYRFNRWVVSTQPTTDLPERAEQALIIVTGISSEATLLKVGRHSQWQLAAFEDGFIDFFNNASCVTLQVCACVLRSYPTSLYQAAVSGAISLTRNSKNTRNQVYKFNLTLVQYISSYTALTVIEHYVYYLSTSSCLSFRS